MDLITRRIIAKREGDNVSDKVLADYADPDSTNYKEMLEEIGKQLNFTTLHYHRLDDLTASIGLSPCKMCTYCFNHQDKPDSTNQPSRSHIYKGTSWFSPECALFYFS